MRSNSTISCVSATLIASATLLSLAGCGSDTRKANAALARAEGDPLVSGEGSASHLYAPPEDRDRLVRDDDRMNADPARRDERISRARPAAAREREMEMNVISLTIPSDEELLLLEARGPMEIRPGESFEYEVDVTNISDRPIANIEIKEHHSENLEFLSTELEGEDAAGDMQTWSIAHLAPGETETILINAEANEAGTADLCLTASMTPLICLVTEVVQPELELTKTGPTEVLRCEPVEYTITVRNTGVGAARGVRIIDELPQGLTSDGGQTIEIDVGTLEAGDTKTFPLVVEATSTGEFTNRARVTSEDGLEREAVYTVTVREPRLEITKSGPTRDFIGAPLDYEITVTNVGDAAARDTVLTESMPRSAEFESATVDGRAAGDRVTWTLGTLNRGESRTVSVRMRVHNEGRFTNTATATAYCAEDVHSEATTTLTGIPGLLIEVVDTEDPVRIGEETSYEIVVTNQGSKVANAVQIKAMLDPGVQFVAASGDTSHRVDDEAIVFEPVRTLEPGDKAAWRVTVRGASAADSRFAVEMTSTELEEPVNEEESTHVYEGE
jgi:uncharacterized repeat protein (TIGR01451 family)